MNIYKLSPSDFTFLWEGCRRCYYLKVAGGLPRPWTPMAKMFNQIDGLQKRFFQGKRTSDISPILPPGSINISEKFVKSVPIWVPGHMSACYIAGKFDTGMAFDNRTFGYGVVDFKTSSAKDDHVPLYTRQLHAYAYALEHPAPGSLHLSPVSTLGLLCVEHVDMLRLGGHYAYRAVPTWIDCPRDDGAFFAFLSEVLTLLESPAPPEASPSCEFCQYRDMARSTFL